MSIDVFSLEDPSLNEQFELEEPEVKIGEPESFSSSTVFSSDLTSFLKPLDLVELKFRHRNHQENMKSSSLSLRHY